MEAADEVDRLGVAHRGSLFEPAERRRLVFIDTLAEREQGRVIVHAPIEPHLGGDAKAGGRAILHNRGAPAEVVAEPDHVDRHHKMKDRAAARSEEHTSEVQQLMRSSYAVFCSKNKKTESSKTTKNIATSKS